VASVCTASSWLITVPPHYSHNRLLATMTQDLVEEFSTAWTGFYSRKWPGKWPMVLGDKSLLDSLSRFEPPPIRDRTQNDRRRKANAIESKHKIKSRERRTRARRTSDWTGRSRKA
jgi:hypothetical protein